MRHFVLDSAMALGWKTDFSARFCSLTSHVTKQCIRILVHWRDRELRQLHLKLQLQVSWVDALVHPTRQPDRGDQ